MPHSSPFFSRLAAFLLCLVLLTPGTARADSENDLVEIQSVDPSIQVELKYATADNITGKILYPPGFKALLRRRVAEDLRKAQQMLLPLGFSLKVWDAYRPLAAQEALFAVVSDPRFVATPGVHSMHNRGVAVDVTLVDASGKEAAMPTKFDTLGPAARYYYSGDNPAIAKNLRTLQRVMSQNGFYACRTEWWHFFSRRWEQAPNLPDKATPPKKKGASQP